MTTSKGSVAAEDIVLGDVDGVHAAVSAAEQRFEFLRKTWGLFIGPIAMLLVLLAPLPALSPDAHHLAAVVTLVVVWWITEPIPIPVTALLGPSLVVVFGIAPAAQAFAPFASTTIFLFIGSFIIGKAIGEHGLDRRLATAILSVPAVGRSATAARMAIGGLVVIMSAWMSNTATAAMMVPLALGIVTSHAGLVSRGGGPTSLMLIVAFSASIGGMATPVGSPPNLITIGLLEQTIGFRINFLTWMAVAGPITLVMTGVLFLAANRRFPLSGGRLTQLHETVANPRAPWTAGQRNCAIVFFAAVILWVTPGVLTLVAPGAPLTTAVVPRLDEAVVAVTCAVLLFLLPVSWSNRQFTLEWKQAASIDWGTILLFGGGLSLGHQMFETGLAPTIGEGVVAMSGATSLWTITALAIGLGIVLTEITSNTAATNMLVPVVISVSQAAGLNPIAPSLGACFGASMAFMLPISTPPNAIVYGTGLVPLRTMLSFGIVIDVLGAIVIFTGLRILCPLLGLV